MTAVLNGHAPPHDDQAERAVLGAVILRPDLVPEVADIVADGDWYHPAHFAIWCSVITLHGMGQSVSVVTVAANVGTDRTLASLGGPAYVNEVANDPNVLPSEATWHARVIADRASERRTMELGTWLVQAGSNGTDPTEVHRRLAARVETYTRTVSRGPSSWAAVDLSPILAGGDSSPHPFALTRRDGKSLLYPGCVHSVAGEPSSGKSWLAILGMAQEVEAGRPVAYIDFEDRPGSLVQRLRDLGVADEKIGRLVRYVRPDTALDAGSRTHLYAAVTGTSLAVVDGVTEAMTMHGLALTDNADVSAWLELIPRRLSDLGPAVLQVDHVVKNADEQGRYAIGGQHKLAGITGVAYKATIIRSFARGVKGKTRLTIAKDRHGAVGAVGSTVAELTLDATDPGRLFAWLDDPTDVRAPDGVWRPTGYMQKVSRWLEVNPGASGKAIEDGVGGKRDVVRTAVATLLTEEHLRTEQGPRGAVLHHVINPFRED